MSARTVLTTLALVTTTAVAPLVPHAAASSPGASTERGASVEAIIIDPPRTGPDLPAYGPRNAKTSRLATTGDAFDLHSDPSADRIIFLDFDGQRVANTLWNDQEGLPAATYEGWSLDADPGFSPTERAFIREVWLAVAEDFAPFQVDVTTEDPGDAAIERSGPNDSTYGTRALITNDDQPLQVICNNECSGVAYPGAFAESNEHAYLQPAWIFGQIQSSQTPKPLAETISHEVGHQFNLSHDGRGSADYYEGHDIWAPIMGFSDYVPVTQWSDGAYADWVTDADFQPTKDDIAVIAESGAPLRDDEAGPRPDSAAPVTSATAFITTRQDKDVWSLGTCVGPLTIKVSPAPFAPNLDLELTLLEQNGTRLATDNPPSFQDGDDLDTAGGMGASITREATGAPLFASVDGIGTGSPSTAYDDFGSVGAYTIDVTGCEGDPGPDPVATTPGAPVIGSPIRGSRGRPYTVGIRWSPPSSDGGSAITGYVVYFDRVDAYGTVLKSFYSNRLDAGRRDATFKVARGLYRFRVVAVNAEGEGDLSVASTTVKAR